MSRSRKRWYLYHQLPNFLTFYFFLHVSLFLFTSIFFDHICFLSIQEALGEESMSDCVLSFVDMLLPVLLGLLKGLDPAQGDSKLRKHCHRVTHVTNLLLNILCLTLLVPLWELSVFVYFYLFWSLNSSTLVCWGLHQIFGVPSGERSVLPLIGWIPYLMLL